MGGSISPRPLEAIEQAVAGERLQTLGGNRWPGTIAAQSLQSAPVCCRNGSVRMQAEARDAGAARAGEGVHALGIDLIPDTRDPAPGIGTKSHFARYSGGVKASQPRLIAGKRIRLLRIAVGSQTSTPEQFCNAFGQRRSPSRDFFIVWRQQHLKLRMSMLIGGIDAVDR